MYKTDTYRSNSLKKYLLDRPKRIRKKKPVTTFLKNKTNVKKNLRKLREKTDEYSLVRNQDEDPDKLSLQYSDRSSSESSISDEYETDSSVNNEYENTKGYRKEFSEDNIVEPSEYVLLNHFQENLASWAIESNICLKDLSRLLKILINDGKHKNLPQDARTLLKTPRSVPIKILDNGQYVYLGIRYFLRKFFKRKSLKCNTLYISISADGTPVSISGNNSLCIIFGCLHVDVFVRYAFDIALFFGLGKPNSFNKVLSEAVQELNYLITNGYTTEDGKKYSIKIKCITADAPALAYIKYVKSHGGYYSCTKCEIKGCYTSTSNSVVYIQTNAPKRTDESFRNRTPTDKDDKHFTSFEHTILEDLPVDMIKDFPLDKMHLVDEGVMKKILILLTLKVSRQKLPPKKTQIINERLEMCRNFMPMEFQRRPRSLKYVLKMKATEYRNFLLYTGPAVSGDVTSKIAYNHFLTLSIAIRILSTPIYYRKYNEYAHKLLKSVVELFPKVYGSHNVSYNVHGLSHLAEDSKRHGPLESYSCYVFEAHIKQVKKMIRSPNMPLQQFCNRLQENLQVELTKPCNNCNSLSKIEFLDNTGENKFYKARINSFIIRADRQGDKYIILTDKTVLEVQYFFNDEDGNPKFMMARKFVNVKPFNENELMSSFNLFTGAFDSQISIYSTKDIMFKMCCLPYKKIQENILYVLLFTLVIKLQ